MKKLPFIAMGLLLDAYVAWASDPDSTGVAKQEEDKGRLTINGYLGSYFFTNFNNPASCDNMGSRA